MNGPIELKTNEQCKLWCKYKNEVRKHTHRNVRNEYFKNRKIDEWEEELKNIHRNMREKMKVLQIVQNSQENEIKKMKEEDILVEECMEKMKKNLISNKSKKTREENKNKYSVRKSKRLIKQSLKNDDIELIEVKTINQIILEKLEKAKKNNNYIDLTV